MKENNKNYVILSVISSFKRIGTRNEIKSFFYKIKEVIKTEERVEEEFSILLIDFYKKYINYEQVKLLIKKLNEIELLFKKHKFYNEYKNLFKEFEECEIDYSRLYTKCAFITYDSDVVLGNEAA